MRRSALIAVVSTRCSSTYLGPWFLGFIAHASPAASKTAPQENSSPGSNRVR